MSWPPSERGCLDWNAAGIAFCRSAGAQPSEDRSICRAAGETPEESAGGNDGAESGANNKHS